MSNLSGMYHLKPVFRNNISIDLPTCMYKMNNILSSNVYSEKEVSTNVSSQIAKMSISNQVKQVLKGLLKNPMMSNIQERQEKILKQLDELRKQILQLKKNLKVVDVSAVNNNREANLSQINNFPDIIMNANPLNPPYALIGLKKLWSNILELVVHTYIHSSVLTLPEAAAAFSKEISQRNKNLPNPKLVVKLIWKDVTGNIELITSSVTNPILGEANVMRYLSRIGPDQYNYELTGNPWEIDFILDVCFLISKTTTKTERLPFLQMLNNKLGKSFWLCNREDMTIADLTAQSIIKQFTFANEINVNLNKWLQRCK